MNPHTHEEIKEWRQDAKAWALEVGQWQEEQARARAALAELEGFLGAHGDQLGGYAAGIEKLGGLVAGDQHHDAAKAAHREAKGLQHSLKAAHHDLMARIGALRPVAAK